MRVALLSHSARAGDAIGRQIAAKVAYFRDHGTDVRVFVETNSGLLAALEPFTSRELDERYLQDCDLIFIEYSQYFAALDVLPRLAGCKARIVFDYHGVTPPSLGIANHRDALERGCRMRSLATFADAVFAHSRYAHGELREASGVSAATLGYPVDLDYLTPGEPGTNLRVTLGLSTSARLLLFVGRVAPNKRVPVLIEALTHLDANVHAVIAGNSGDAYDGERQRIRERAARLGVASRVHFLGRVNEEQLRDAYRSADAFVMPSVHEGFCLPVVEAMACGIPVIASRATALPESLGDAGLTFTPGDAVGLARMVDSLHRDASCHRVLPSTPSRIQRIAVVASRYGDGFAGGAEASLRQMARTLASSGYSVEVFCTTDPGASELPTVVDGLTVHRLRREPTDSGCREEASAAIHAGTADSDTIDRYLHNTTRSPRLIAALRERGKYDAILVGPYPTGLTRDVVAAFPMETVLVPCFHDEPLARRSELIASYSRVGGIVYHSVEEKQLAETVFGLNHPNSHVASTPIDIDTPGDPRRGRRLVGSGRRYVASIGRYCREKGLPELVAFARRYATDHPERFTFAFVGEGESLIPNESWARNLGFVSERDRRDVTTGADALINLSPNESLSLAVLEAQAQGVPVVVRADCSVTAGHVKRGHGGVAIDGYEEFAAVLDDLWRDPVHWREMGRRGREYVRTRFGSPATFAKTLAAAVDGLTQPIVGLLRTNGMRRARDFDSAAWRSAFGAAVEQILDTPPARKSHALEVRPRLAEIRCSGSAAFIPVRLDNRGQLAELAEGTNRTRLVSRAYEADGTPAGPEIETGIPTTILPDQGAVAVVRVALPTEPGEYLVAISLRRGDVEATPELPDVRVPLVVTPPSTFAAPPSVAMPVAIEAVDLPDSYVDVSEGFAAGLKKWAKRKLLHNFQQAFVNVLSRQQSAFNRRVASAIAELSDGQAATAHMAHEAAALREDVRRLQRQNARLARRLAQLESATEETTA
ncbi:MAG: glycosyltransferase [Gemmataceae bacterium]